jgi:nucleotide-binding universal stress UspA family protein
MSYRTILVHVDDSPQAGARIRAAARLALDAQAHLVGAAMTGVSRFLPPGSLELDAPAIAEHLALMRQRAQLALQQFDAIAAQMGVPSAEHRLVNDDTDGGLTLQARYADLVVLSQFNPDLASASRSDLPEYVFLSTPRPVLVLPHQYQDQPLGKRVMVAWDGSVEATRALTAALPLLKAALLVTVSVFGAGAHAGAHGEQPGADIALYLSRHGVNVDVVSGDGDIDAGQALLAQAARLGIDLLVMGGYGHTRLREMLLGGVTRTVLESMTMPVLFSH